MYYLSRICFMCLSERDLKNVFQNGKQNEIFQQILYILPDFSTLDEKNAVYICSTCYKLFQSFSKFKNMCLKNFYRLKHFMDVLEGQNREQSINNHLHITTKNIDLLEEKKIDICEDKKEIQHSLISSEENYDEDIHKKITQEYVTSEEHEQQECNTQVINPIHTIESQTICNISEYNNSTLPCKENLSSTTKNIELLRENTDICVTDKKEIQHSIISSEKHEDIHKKTTEIYATSKERKEEKCNGTQVINSNYTIESQTICNTSEHSNNTLLCEENLPSKVGLPEDTSAPVTSQCPSPENLLMYYKSQDKYFKCTICEKEFKHLDKHMKSHLARNYECNICGKTFAYNHKLNQHMKIHIGKKEFECTICDRKFLLKNHLKDHMNIHLGIKPFECYICNRKFVQNSTWRRHLKGHSVIESVQFLSSNRQYVSKQ